MDTNDKSRADTKLSFNCSDDGLFCDTPDCRPYKGKSSLDQADDLRKEWRLTGTGPYAQPAAPAVDGWRETLYMAAVNCSHMMDDDKVVLYRDPRKDGNALSQLADRLAAAVPPGAVPVEQPSMAGAAKGGITNPPGTTMCDACEGRGAIYQCVICGSCEAKTGTCGSDDPRALCNFLAHVARQPAAATAGTAHYENLALVIARLEQIQHVGEGSDVRGLAKEALVCAHAIAAPTLGSTPRADDEELRTYRQALEIIGVRDCTDPQEVATAALVGTGFWSKERSELFCTPQAERPAVPIYQEMSGEFGEYWSDVNKAAHDEANEIGITTRIVYVAPAAQEGEQGSAQAAPADGAMARYRFLLSFLLDRGVLHQYGNGIWRLRGIYGVDDSGLKGAGRTPEEALDNAIVAANLDPVAADKFWSASCERVLAAPDDVPDSLEALIIEKRISIMPEYEGGFHVAIYGDEERPKARGQGRTPSEAINTAIRALRSTSTDGSAA